MGRNDRTYFLYAPSVDAVKIGASGNPEERLRVISPGSPVEIHLLGSFARTEAMQEKELHEKYVDYGTRWGWFTCNGPLHDLLTELFGDTYLSLRKDKSPSRVEIENVELRNEVLKLRENINEMNTRHRWWKIWERWTS